MSDENDNDNKKHYLREFCAKTTIHGLPNIADSNNLFQRIFWILVTIGGVAVCLALIIVSIVSYFSFEVSYSYSVINESPAVYPAITFCNLVPFNVLDNKLFFSNVLKEINLTSQIEPTDQEPGLNQVNERKELIKAAILSNKTTNITSLGFSIQTMLISCTFNNAPCFDNEFHYFYDINYGNCYTFNYNSSKPKLTSKHGSKYGLKLELFAGLPARDDYFSTERGIYMAITNNSVLPVSNYDGIKLAVGQSTDVKISRIFYSKLDSPYSKCRLDVKTPSKKDSRVFNRTLELNNYTLILCYDLCLQKDFIERQCNCSDHSFYQYNVSMPICNTSSLIKCAHDVKDEFDTQKISEKCDTYCPTPCDSIKYQTSTSISTYPTDYYFDILIKTPNVKEKFKTYLNNNTNLSDIGSIVRNSILKVNVYYDELSYTFISESASVTVVSMLGTIGGHLGLFIGMSVLSFFEIFEIALQFFLNSYTKRKQILKQKINNIELK